MREPAFWWRQQADGLLAPLTGPLGAFYGVVAGRRMKRPGYRIGLPVICLGNPTLGGAGKTPAALAVAHLLHAAHERPFFLSRGYGGTLAGPVRVNPQIHRAADVGDEPLLLARLAPTIVARDRVAGANFAKSTGAGVLVMDDGFQNPSLGKDLSILVIDGRGIGNARVFPAGPLRAPLAIQLECAQALLVIGQPGNAAAVVERARRGGLRIFHARLEPDRGVVAAIGRRKVLAFAGIGHPDKFFASLAEAGIAVAERAPFADHHRYTAAEAAALIARARARCLLPLTTEKDMMRLVGEPALQALADSASALPVRLVVAEEDAFRSMVLGAVKRQ